LTQMNRSLVPTPMVFEQGAVGFRDRLRAQRIHRDAHDGDLRGRDDRTISTRDIAKRGRAAPDARECDLDVDLVAKAQRGLEVAFQPYGRKADAFAANHARVVVTGARKELLHRDVEEMKEARIVDDARGIHVAEAHWQSDREGHRPMVTRPSATRALTGSSR